MSISLLSLIIADHVSLPCPIIKPSSFYLKCPVFLCFTSYLNRYLNLYLSRPVVCPTEILAFNAALEKFAGINTEIIGVSTDSEFTHLAWSQTPRNQGGLGPDLKLTLVRFTAWSM